MFYKKIFYTIIIVGPALFSLCGCSISTKHLPEVRIVREPIVSIYHSDSNKDNSVIECVSSATGYVNRLVVPNGRLADDGIVEWFEKVCLH